jgi:hypothetical protein
MQFAKTRERKQIGGRRCAVLAKKANLHVGKGENVARSVRFFTIGARKFATRRQRKQIRFLAYCMGVNGPFCPFFRDRCMELAE